MHHPADSSTSTTNSEPTARLGLFADDRGAIFVIGVFFTFIWIGMVWFLFGIGNVIAYRENMQNAADAAAFAAAVYDARGMNMIALINNLMGIALATLVLMKFAQIAVLVAKGADCKSQEAKCVDPFYIPIAAFDCFEDCEDVNNFKGKVKDFDQTVHGILQGMHTAETVIAGPRGWPLIASGKSQVGGALPNWYAFGVDTTATLAWSQLDSSSDPAVKGAVKPTSNTCKSFPDGSGTVSDNTCPIGPRCGLPVTSDSYSTVCHAALDDVFEVGKALPGPFTSALSYLSEFQYIWGSDFFCDDHTYPSTAVTVGNTVWGSVGAAAVSAILFPECEVFAAITGGGITRGKDSLIPDSGPAIPKTCSAWSTMTLYGPADMGLDYYSVWSKSTGVWKKGGTKKDFAQNPVQVAGVNSKGGTKVVADLPEDADTALARAEFYYEPQGSAGTPAANENQTNEVTVPDPGVGVQMNAMWNMRWRARLRRFHFMPGLSPLADVSGVGNVASISYYAAVVADTTAFEKILLSGGIPGLKVPEVNSQANPPPFGMYH